MNHQHSTSDFRYLDINTLSGRAQITGELLDMGTNPEVVDWFFTQFDAQKADYTKEIGHLNTLIDNDLIQ